MAARPTRFAVTGLLADNAARTSFTKVPGLVLSKSEVVAALVGGKNGAGEVVPGGWADLLCDTCGDRAHWCPDLRAVLPVGFVAERQEADLTE